MFPMNKLSLKTIKINWQEGHFNFEKGWVYGNFTWFYNI